MTPFKVQSSKFKVQSFLALALALLAITSGCSHLQPGADPLVVRCEQTETIAYATFDTFLQIDDSNRAFWKTNTPALHSFAEYLRAPVPDGTANCQRGISYIRGLNTVKRAYKQGSASSNAVVTILATVETAVIEAQKHIATATATTH
jgi:hypothetical protein